MILLDADGVFADLHKPLMEIFNFKMENWPAGEYAIEKVTGLTARQLWQHPKVLHPDFWANLPKTPWADELMELILTKYSKDEICFLTKPVMDPNCASGKMRWFKKHYSRFKFLIGTSKKFCAGPNRILLDDSEENVDEFTAHGGLGVLFPRIWNREHHIKDPMTKMRQVFSK
jgi:5'(3')-deoxyribonucleotidase